MLSICLKALLLVSIVSMPAHAKTRVYEAPIRSATWNFDSKAGSQCSITHEIPYYGKAAFTRNAGKTQDVNFIITVERNKPANAGVATIKSNAPAWRSDLSPRELGKTKVSPGVAPIMVQNDDAWRLLTELERGMSPAFYYDGWISGEDQVIVSLLPVHFKSVFKKFVDCIAGLPVYGAEDVANSFVYFHPGKATFTKEAGSRLKVISAYLQESDKPHSVMVQGHADSRGSYSYNDWLSRKRAEAVKQYLVHAGVDKAKIKVRNYGERKPVSSNNSDVGRLKNRRVVIKVSQG